MLNNTKKPFNKTLLASGIIGASILFASTVPISADNTLTEMFVQSLIAQQVSPLQQEINTLKTQIANQSSSSMSLTPTEQPILQAPVAVQETAIQSSVVVPIDTTEQRVTVLEDTVAKIAEKVPTNEKQTEEMYNQVIEAFYAKFSPNTPIIYASPITLNKDGKEYGLSNNPATAKFGIFVRIVQLDPYTQKTIYNSEMVDSTTAISIINGLE
jgi:hypothetical protein